MINSEEIESYWQAYLAARPGAASAGPYIAEQFGDSPELANSLGALIVQGVKTATCSSVWEWEAQGMPLPEAGLKTIVLDASNIPLCIIETTEVEILPYNQVGASFARDEGEGDLSLEFWREAHWNYFSRALPKIGREPSQDMPVVCERFRVVSQ